MTSSDDPDRDRRFNTPKNFLAARSRFQTRVATNWSRAARTEYSALKATVSSQHAPSAQVLNAVAKKAARATLSHLATNTKWLERFSAAQSFSIDLSFVSDAEIQELNASYRGKNKPTDVLSFAQNEGETFPGMPVAGLEAFGENVLLGDLIIAVGTSHHQASELQHSLEREIAFLAIHGVLHLCGLDHDTSSRRRAMFKLQDTITESLFDASGSVLNPSSCSLR